jgi:hypothetical protein
LEPVTVTEVIGGPDVGDKAMEGGGVTSKVAIELAVPLVAVIVAWPATADDGTVKVVEKEPVTVAVAVATFVPLNVIWTVELAG